ncbi:DNA mismatch repair endonuclease MutL [Paenibacillus sp. GCM10023252]|uniref:DNA mismatch repair endonuclease MutL n=1 Tax=Paenibacillus sp. GCM10023252 TaxID=3252649 RepID=UPI003610AF6D
MGRIRVLDEQLANQIAAGEVVERPSSVIKELVENAVDAGSTTIDIAIEEGGLTSIRVVDNGSGIDAEEIETAFHRHATSKISSNQDLFRIASLGFRGEALPSIAAVARVECISSTETGGLGHRILIEGGSKSADEPYNAMQGTDISVRDLFYNTPARLKYMKSIQTELGHISDYVNRIALAHPGIAFTLKHNGSTLLRTLGTGDRLQVIAAVYGSNTAKAMLPIESEDADYDLRGYISKPELTRANRNGITVVVNGRYIRSHAINQAVLQAYHTLLPINRFPLIVLEFGMHPSLLDVNVHPSKMEVRFSKETELREFVEDAVRKVLGRQRHIPGPDAGKTRDTAVFVQERISFHRPEAEFSPLGATKDSARHEQTRSNPADNSDYKMNTAWKGAGGDRRTSSPYAPPLPQQRDNIPPDATERLYSPPKPSSESAVRELRAPWEEAAPAAEKLRLEKLSENLLPEKMLSENLLSETLLPESEQPRESAPLEAPESAHASFPELSWIGQMHGTYIIAQSEEGLYLIDQHAAHERINYEYYLRKFGNPESASQPLLVPLTLEFTSGEASLLRDKLHLLEDAGLELEPFGAQTFLVRSHPEWLPAGEEQAVIEEMADWILTERKAIDIGKLREKAAIMCSCKASIKANDRMSREEGEVLLNRLAQCQQPYTCPHGRPIVVHLTTYQLEKMFKRVMS